jgi:prepilin-type N-terminal cleavage/methylation domain-containing protein
MKLSKNNKTSTRGFTLIELLVVIAIIATLGGLSFGPIMKFLSTADLTKTTKVCKDLTFAITGFEQEYDSLPYTGTSGYPADDSLEKTDTNELLNVLMGNDPLINDKNKIFFKADQAKGSKDGLVYTGSDVTSLLDKWGNAYHILLDYSGDGELNATNIGPAATGISYKTELHVDDAIAASPGRDSTFNDEQDAKSW